jgi:hypothetical protein
MHVFGIWNSALWARAAALPATIIAVVMISAGTLAHASLIIDPTYDPSLTVADDAAISAAIAGVEADITSPKSLTVDIYFNSMSSGLGESDSTISTVSYYQYYTALAAVATSAAQMTALDSLGAAPNPGSGNPVNGNPDVQITSAEGRNLGLNTPGSISVGAGTYDSEISLNTSITYPPGTNDGSNYGLQAVANHEIDEALGIGGSGSNLEGTGSLTGPVGDLDLYRYSCNIPVATLVATLTCPAGDASRSYSNTQMTSPFSYFSINGGETVLSFFSQTTGVDFGDWLSNCSNATVCAGNGIPNGFGPQVQDAIAEPSTNPILGVNELTAFNAIGYTLVAPEPSTLALAALSLVSGYILVRRRRTAA